MNKKKLKKIEENRNATIDDLMQKAQIKDKEKKELLKKIKTQDEEYSEARKELFTLKRNLDDIQLENDNLPLGLENHVKGQIKHVFGHKSAESTVKRQFNKIINYLHKDALKDMEHYNLINGNYELTPKGSIFINKIMRENR